MATTAPNKAEKAHHALLRNMGCIVCRNLRLGETPPEIHHIRDIIDRRTEHMRVIPLCSIHHRTGALHRHAALQTGWARWAHVGYHQAPAEFEKRYRKQRKLLLQVEYLAVRT